ncbi:MAG: hypothetical protein HQL22_12740 [Candidatus Omnitrophica bacterium]|nr:hypothetical protein [Candidatus Omnitrophota bacterium]
MPANSVRFKRMLLKDYGVFTGFNELRFQQHTIIAGSCGTGKTILAKALSALGPATGVKSNAHSVDTKIDVVVETDGKRDYIDKYRDLIFIDGESIDQGSVFFSIVNNQDLATVTEVAQKLFGQLSSRKIDLQRELVSASLPGCERVCLVFAYLFAVREKLAIDLPLVLDAPFGRLDDEHKSKVVAFLKQQTIQQIWLCQERDLVKGCVPDYVLDHNEGGTKIRKVG